MSICYLCGNPIEPGTPESGDHRVPRVLLQGAAPKRRGFDFAGRARTHPDCNSHFRGENFAALAMRLLAIVKSGQALTIVRHPDDPDIEIQILERDKFPDYSDRDLTYFHLIDRTESDAPIPPATFFASQKRTNLERESIFVVMSVVAKSAAALLINDHKMPLPQQWRIETGAWFGEPYGLASDLLAQSRIFHEGVRVWTGMIDGAHCALYFTHGAVVGLQFGDLPTTFLNDLEAELGRTDRLLFQGQRLLELIDYRWPHAPRSGIADIGGRNVRCECGSGRRFKHCHGRLA